MAARCLNPSEMARPDGSDEAQMSLQRLDAAAQRIDLHFEGAGVLQLPARPRRAQRPVDDRIQRYKPLRTVYARHHSGRDLGAPVPGAQRRASYPGGAGRLLESHPPLLQGLRAELSEHVVPIGGGSLVAIAR